MKFFHAEVKSFSAKELCFIDVTKSEIKVNVFSHESNMRDMPTKREQMNDADDFIVVQYTTKSTPHVAIVFS